MRVCPYGFDANRTILDGSTLWPSWSFVLVPRWVVCVCDEWCTFCESMGRVERRGVYSGCKAGKCDECEQLSLSNCYCNEAISLKRSETTFAGEWITPLCLWRQKKVDVMFSFSVDGVGCVEIIQLRPESNEYQFVGSVMLSRSIDRRYNALWESALRSTLIATTTVLLSGRWTPFAPSSTPMNWFRYLV